MLSKWIFGLAAVLALGAAFVASRPAEFEISRSAVISASPEAVFALVNDLHRWEAWSPWAKLDPNAKNSFEGPDSGVGAVMRWSGNQEVGVGSMTITESERASRIAIRLEFQKPFQATNAVGFIFKPENNQTRVTWTMSGRNNFFGKAMGLLMNCDKMVGGQYEKGLANLKSLAEAGKS